MSKIYRHNKWKLIHPKTILMWPLWGIFWIIGQLPHKTAIKLGNLLGSLIYYFFPKRKYIVRTNLKTCFPDKSNQEIEKLTKQNIQSLVAGVCETAIAWFGPRKTIEKLGQNIEIIGEDILKNALANATTDEPVLLITPHTVSQELLSRYMCHIKGYDYAPVFRHMNDPVANYIMQKARLKIYKHLLLKADTRNIIKTIKQNKFPVGILPDQDFGRKRSVFVSLFGTPTATTTSLSKYKKLTNAKMIIGSYHRVFNKDSGQFEKFVITLYPELNITGNDLEHDARQLNIALETIIKKDITAYFWVAKKFKTRPLGEAKIYNYKSKNYLKNFFSNIKLSLKKKTT